MREAGDKYWARQLSFATVLGFVTFLIAFPVSCGAFTSHFQRLHPLDTQSALGGFYFAVPTGMLAAGTVFALVLWRGYARRRRRRVEDEMD